VEQFEGFFTCYLNECYVDLCLCAVGCLGSVTEIEGEED